MIDNTIFNNKKVVFHTLGCKLNFAETSSIGRQLADAGFLKARAGEEADICIINTCSVTDTADHKCRQAISKLNRLHPKAKMIVTGCYAQLKPEEIAAIDGVDLVLGANEKFDILGYLDKLEDVDMPKILREDILKIKRFKPSISHDDRTRYFLKVQDGCDYYCTFCTIPLARGHSRSGTIADTVDIARAAIDEGAMEIVLTGVNTGEFGKRNGESFLDLLKALDRLDDNVRYRISSVEPNLLTNDIIHFVAGSRCIMPHFHIPLQSGSNEVLKLMKRRYTAEFFEEKINYIRQVTPNAFIGVDTIVGVHGETEGRFEQSYRFIENLDFSQLHVFTYSERAGTKMLEIEHHVPIKERKRRSEVLHQLSAQKTIAFYEKQMGRKECVLWEEKKSGGVMYGFTANYIRVEKPYDKAAVNTIQEVLLGGWNEEKSALLAIEEKR